MDRRDMLKSPGVPAADTAAASTGEAPSLAFGPYPARLPETRKAVLTLRL